MSLSASSTRQVHTILGGGMRFETAELVLSTIPNFELKQKGRILHLFTETYVFMQEIQEALDEQQNNIDSLLAHNQTNVPLAEPFIFESQIDTNTYPIDLSSRSSSEAVPLLAVPTERNHSKIPPSDEERSKWKPVQNSMNIKKEAVTPPKSKRRRSKNSKQKNTSLDTSLRQMTMTQLFDPLESPQSIINSTPIKQEANTPVHDDTVMFMPESLIGLAQPSESISDDNYENDQNMLLNVMSPTNELPVSNIQSFKRKSSFQQITTDEEENIENEAILQSPYSGIESEELLYACPMCRNYWLGLPQELRHKEGLTCRHRQRPVVHTPEHFWSLGIPDTQTCIQRGYGGVLPPDKPTERPRRPRRQHQRRLQQQQQQQQEEEETDEEE